MQLTDRFVRNAPQGTHPDGGGLYLRVRGTGKRTWIFRNQKNGRDAWVTIGAYPETPLSAARDRAAVIRAGTPADLAFGDAFEQYYKSLAREYRRPEQTRRMFDNDLLPDLGHEPLLRITRADVTSVLQKIVDRGSPVMANRALGAVKRFFDYCEQKGWIPFNPVAGVRARAVGGRERSKTYTLSFEEIGEFFTMLRGMTPGTAWALYMLLLTGKRASEVLSFKPTCADRLTGPAKTKPYTLAVTPHIRRMLLLAPTLPKDHRVLSHALRRLGKPYTPHDLRRTFASRQADLGVAPHIIEKLLDHQMEGTMAVYNRAEYWPERVSALSQWGRTLAAIRRKSAPTSGA